MLHYDGILFESFARRLWKFGFKRMKQRDSYIFWHPSLHRNGLQLASTIQYHSARVCRQTMAEMSSDPAMRPSDDTTLNSSSASTSEYSQANLASNYDFAHVLQSQPLSTSVSLSSQFGASIGYGFPWATTPSLNPASSIDYGFPLPPQPTEVLPSAALLSSSMEAQETLGALKTKVELAFHEINRLHRSSQEWNELLVSFFRCK